MRREECSIPVCGERGAAGRSTAKAEGSRAWQPGTGTHVLTPFKWRLSFTTYLGPLVREVRRPERAGFQPPPPSHVPFSEHQSRPHAVQPCVILCVSHDVSAIVTAMLQNPATDNHRARGSHQQRFFPVCPRSAGVAPLMCLWGP